MQTNLIDRLLLEPIRMGYSNREIIVDNGFVYNYRKLLDMVQACASSQVLNNYAVGDTVACILSDSISSIVIFLALIHQGFVPCLINIALADFEYETLLKDLNCVAIVSNGNKGDLFKKLSKKLDVNYILSDDLLYKPNKKNTIIEQRFYNIAFCLFTSGTTGKPSLVLHKHNDPVIMNKQYGKKVLHLATSDIILATSRFYFAYGLNTLFFSLLNQAKLLIPPDPIEPKSIWNILAYYKPTILFSVPTMYKRLLNVLPSQKDLWSSLRLCVSAGENLPLTILESWESKVGSVILDGIGTTEILSTFISNRIEKFKPGSTGYVVPGFQVKLQKITNDHEPTSRGDIGVLWVKGNTYIPYYINNPKETKNRFNNGWFKTNDLFFVDKDGFYFYQGRINDLIKVSGIWIYPYKIEKAIQNHPAISEAIVVGQKEQDGLMRIVAYVVLTNSNDANENLIKEIKDFARASCAHHEYPHFVYFVDSIPKTPSGKPIRNPIKLKCMDSR